MTLCLMVGDGDRKTTNQNNNIDNNKCDDDVIYSDENFEM